MIHFVYVVGRGSLWNDNELRYSLRSLQKNFRGDFDVAIIGQIPEWLDGSALAGRLPLRDSGQNPIVNVTEKLAAFADCAPPDFVLMNDDFFIMKPVSSIPVHHGGPMSTRLNELRGRVGLYTDAFRGTYSAIQQYGIKQPLRYDRHTPFPMTAAGLSYVLGEFRWNLLLKSLYGNVFHRSEGKPSPDVKAGVWGGRSAFWSASRALPEAAKRLLKRAFPERSIYERA